MLDGLAGNIIPPNDSERLRALKEYDILYTSAEETFDNITQMMAQAFSTPMSFISLVDKDTVFYKSQAGQFGRDAVKRTDSLCSLAILNDTPLVIEDASKLDALKDNPYVQPEGGLRFYAGAPLITKDGYHVGTACVVDTKTRTFTDSEQHLLARFAKMVMHEIEVRKLLKSQLDTEAKLFNSYKELQFVTDTMPQMVWATEPDGYSFFFNKGWLQYSGLSLAEVVGDGWMQSLHPDDYQRTVDAWNDAVIRQRDYDIEYRLKRYDGVYRWFVARGNPMKDEQGNILKWYGTCTDIQDQKITQEHLQQAKERFDLVSKATQDVIWDWNLENNLVWWNEAFKEKFGYNAADIEPDAQSWYGRVHPNDRERIIGGIHHVIDHGGINWSDEYRFLKKDGSYAIVYDRGYVLHHPNGTAYRMLGSMQDVTEARGQQEKLKESEQRFQAAIAAVQGVLWTNNSRGEMEGEQPGWHALTGQTQDEYQGFGWSSAVHPNDAQATVDAWNQAVEARRMFVFEHRLKTKSGEWRHFTIRAIPVLKADGSIKEWVGVHTDVTEQRLAEEKVRQSEMRFQNLVKEATVGIIVLTGPEMRVEVVNQAYGRLIQRSARELLDKNLFDIIPEAEPVFRPIIDKVRTTGEPIYLFDQNFAVYKDGTTIQGYLNLVYQPYQENGVTTGVMVLCHDVTGQVLARKKVAEAEETARLAIAAAELGTFHLDFESDELKTSERLQQILELGDKANQQSLFSAFHPDDQVRQQKAFEEARQNGVLEYEARVPKADGSIRWIRLKGQLTLTEQQQPQRLAGVVQDITEEKQFSEELSRRVKEQTHDLEQFTYVSHHDLQEPLRKIIMFTDMVKAESEGLLSERAKSRLEKVAAAARRMRDALRDVLDFASLSKEEQFTQVDLNETIASVLTDLELVISDKSAQIDVALLPTIAAVPQQMHQLFYNLLNNALKFSVPGNPPVIKVAVQPISGAAVSIHSELDANRSYVRISVLDNGIGFDQKSAEIMFKLFQRLHSRDKYPGTGIGLALCKKVVHNHGGEIWAESDSTSGATFHVILPI